RPPRQAVDQIDPDVGKAGGARRMERPARRLGSMVPAERLQMFVRERLNPHRKTVDSPFPKQSELGKIDRGGMRLERHLGIGRHRENLSTKGEKVHQRGGRIKGRRSPAEVEARHHPVPPDRIFPIQFDLPPKGGKVPLRQPLPIALDVEGAKRAAGEAKRKVDVKSGRIHLRSHSSISCRVSFAAIDPSSFSSARWAFKKARSSGRSMSYQNGRRWQPTCCRVTFSRVSVRTVFDPQSTPSKREGIGGRPPIR